VAATQRALLLMLVTSQTFREMLSIMGCCILSTRRALTQNHGKNFKFLQMITRHTSTEFVRMTHIMKMKHTILAARLPVSAALVVFSRCCTLTR
jgi:hypothetical protein